MWCKKLKFGLFCLSLLCFQLSYAQPSGFSPVINTAKLQAGLSKSTKYINSFASDFTQVKSMKMLNDQVKSKGKFYFMKEDKVRIEYNDPYTYILVINKGRIMINDGKRTNKVNSGGSKTMESINQIMLDCMRGTVFNNKDFKIKAYENNKEHLLMLFPIDTKTKEIFKAIEVYIAKTDYAVLKLIMNEHNGDNTVMEFSNKQINPGFENSLFNLR